MKNKSENKDTSDFNANTNNKQYSCNFLTHIFLVIQSHIIGIENLMRRGDKMHNNMKHMFAIAIGLSVVFGSVFIIVDNQTHEASAQVEIMSPSPAHGALPLSPVLRGTTMQLSIDADDIIERHSGTEIAVWNSAATPVFGISCPLRG